VVPCQRIGVNVIGLEVPHTHIHLMPIDSMSDLDFKLAKPAAPEDLAATAAKIRAVLVANGHAEARL
jgi:diadenosine tetraphosphate (Ap4A) HIT family hydrolase